MNTLGKYAVRIKCHDTYNHLSYNHHSYKYLDEIFQVFNFFFFSDMKASSAEVNSMEAACSPGVMA